MGRCERAPSDNWLRRTHRKRLLLWRVDVVAVVLERKARSRLDEEASLDRFRTVHAARLLEILAALGELFNLRRVRIGVGSCFQTRRGGRARPEWRSPFRCYRRRSPSGASPARRRRLGLVCTAKLHGRRPRLEGLQLPLMRVGNAPSSGSDIGEEKEREQSPQAPHRAKLPAEASPIYRVN